MLKIGDTINHNDEQLLILDIGSVYVIAYKNFNDDHINMAKANKTKRLNEYAKGLFYESDILILKGVN